MDAALLASHIGGAADAVVVVDWQGNILVANDAAHTLFGYRATQLVGASVEVLIPEGVRELHETHRSQFATRPEPRMMGTRTIRLFGLMQDGSSFPAEISLSPVGNGEGLTTMAIIRDVTERVQVDAENQMVRQSLDAVDEAVFMFATDTLEFCYANSGACRQTGYSAKELLAGMTPLDIKPEFDRTTFDRLITPLLRGEQSVVTFETVHRHKSGVDTPVEVMLQDPGNLETGKQCLIALVRDISVRQAQHRRLIQSERAFRSAFEDAPVGMAIADLSQPEKRVIVSANAALGEILGYSTDELVGRTFESITHEDDRPADADGAVNLAKGNLAVYRTEKRYVHADGHTVTCLLSAVHLGGEDNPRSLAHIVDLTRRLEVEAQRDEALEAAREQSTQLELAQDRERIARELQDRVIQRLFAVGMSLQAAIESPEILKDAALAAVEEIDSSITVVRDTIFKLAERRN